MRIEYHNQRTGPRTSTVCDICHQDRAGGVLVETGTGIQCIDCWAARNAWRIPGLLASIADPRILDALLLGGHLPTPPHHTSAQEPPTP